MNERGSLIALEGIDGAGTTTQARLLVKWLQQAGRAAHLTCEPSSGPLGSLLRNLLTHSVRPIDRAALALLFAADRVDHVEHEILPMLEQGTHVITDRYVYSSLAYQSLDLDVEWVARINERAPEPDLTVYLRVEPGVAEQRRAARGAPRELFETAPEQARIAQLYDQLFGTSAADGSWIADPAGSGWIEGDPRRSRGIMEQIHRRARWAVLNGTLPVEELHHHLRELVRKICPCA